VLNPRGDTVKATNLKNITIGTAFLSLVLVGCNKSPTEATQKVEQASAAMPSNLAKVSITVNEDGFSPSAIKAKKGEPLKLEFKRTSDSTCAKSVAFPELNLTKDLPLNTPVAIDVPTDQARTLTFQCGMGMYKSSVVVM